jgi:hypothetical protein
LRQQQGEGLPTLLNRRSLKLKQQQGEGLPALLNRRTLKLKQQKDSQLYLKEGVCVYGRKRVGPRAGMLGVLITTKEGRPLCMEGQRESLRGSLLTVKKKI